MKFEESGYSCGSGVWVWRLWGHVFSETVGGRWHVTAVADRPNKDWTKITNQKNVVKLIDSLFSQLFVPVLCRHFLPFLLSHHFPLGADCTQTHTNELCLNAERIQLAAKATGEFSCATEVTWPNRYYTETETVSADLAFCLILLSLFSLSWVSVLLSFRSSFCLSPSCSDIFFCNYITQFMIRLHYIDKTNWLKDTHSDNVIIHNSAPKKTLKFQKYVV